MAYPKFIKIFMEDGVWCGKLIKNAHFGEDIYISELISLKNDSVTIQENESYSVEDLENDKLKYEEITKDEYLKSVIEGSIKHIDLEIKDLRDSLEVFIINLYIKITKLKKEKKLIIDNCKI